MFSRILSNSSKCLSRHIKQRSMCSYKNPALREATMNDTPLPENFQELYRKRQVGNNFVLVAGTTFFALTAYFVFNSGVIFMNRMPPKKLLDE